MSGRDLVTVTGEAYRAAATAPRRATQVDLGFPQYLKELGLRGLLTHRSFVTTRISTSRVAGVSASPYLSLTERIKAAWSGFSMSYGK